MTSIKLPRMNPGKKRAIARAKLMEELMDALVHAIRGDPQAGAKALSRGARMQADIAEELRMRGVMISEVDEPLQDIEVQEQSNE